MFKQVINSNEGNGATLEITQVVAPIKMTAVRIRIEKLSILKNIKLTKLVAKSVKFGVN